MERKGGRGVIERCGGGGADRGYREVWRGRVESGV